MRDVLRVFFSLIVILSCFITIWGYIRHIKVSQKLKKQNGTDIVNKETVSKETLDELKIAIRLIFIGIITTIVFKIIRILIEHRII